MRRFLPCLPFLLLAAPAAAQQGWSPPADDSEWQTPPPPPPAPVGQTAESAAGRVGERQRADQAEGIEPMARIQGRVANRVQSRIRNRIDRHYDPQANAASPFVVAGQAQARATRRSR